MKLGSSFDQTTTEQHAGHEVASCPICEAPDTVRFSFPTSGNNVYACRNCGVEFQYPQPNDAVLGSIYSENYFLGSGSPEAEVEVAQLKQATAALYLDVITQFVEPSTSTLCEVGCGSGDFLLAARSRGFEVEGLEYSEHAAAEANLRVGASRVRVGSLDTVVLPTEAYDVVSAFDVIEHVRNPRHSIELLHDCLKVGGILAIVTPSLHSWSRRALGRHWMEYKTEHLTYFSPKSLRALLSLAGFSEVSFRPNYKVLTFDYICRHFARYPVRGITPVLRSFRNAIPEKLAHARFRIVASGVMAMARKTARAV